jgi:hypothetical protein
MLDRDCRSTGTPDRNRGRVSKPADQDFPVRLQDEGMGVTNGGRRIDEDSVRAEVWIAVKRLCAGGR